jgi:hypothetical protein
VLWDIYIYLDSVVSYIDLYIDLYKSLLIVTRFNLLLFCCVEITYCFDMTYEIIDYRLSLKGQGASWGSCLGPAIFPEHHRSRQRADVHLVSTIATYTRKYPSFIDGHVEQANNTRVATRLRR